MKTPVGSAYRRSEYCSRLCSAKNVQRQAPHKIKKKGAVTGAIYAKRTCQIWLDIREGSFFRRCFYLLLLLFDMLFSGNNICESQVICSEINFSAFPELITAIFGEIDSYELSFHFLFLRDLSAL